MDRLCDGFISHQNQLLKCYTLIYPVEKPDVTRVNLWALVRVENETGRRNGGLGHRHCGPGIKAGSARSRNLLWIMVSLVWDIAEVKITLTSQGFSQKRPIEHVARYWPVVKSWILVEHHHHSCLCPCCFVSTQTLRLGKNQLLASHQWDPKISSSFGNLEAARRRRGLQREKPRASELGEWHITKILY